jgi:hypothetical protein
MEKPVDFSAKTAYNITPTVRNLRFFGWRSAGGETGGISLEIFGKTEIFIDFSC